MYGKCHCDPVQAFWYTVLLMTFMYSPLYIYSIFIYPIQIPIFNYKWHLGRVIKNVTSAGLILFSAFIILKSLRGEELYSDCCDFSSHCFSLSFLFMLIFFLNMISLVHPPRDSHGAPLSAHQSVLMKDLPHSY